ncbi:MAG TPA: hypothetical protein PK863_06350 [Candidatus Dojkabacteria bacterium]|nr:hypothetical protein [Candidatus Dojkabacteria bacterium]HRP51159.1 hypothetical protein [Candidatus Dojkabacteria bacterium]
MKIYFTASTVEFNRYKKTYFAIRDYLVQENHTLTRDWLKHTGEKINDGDLNVRDIKAIYKKCVLAINQAQLVIIEDTVSNFSTGHQITLALQKQKPTLVLWQGKKHRYFNQMFIHGIDSEHLEIAEYKPNNIEKIITAFINKYQDYNNKTRFNLVLNQYERNYLDWVQFNRGTNRTKIIKTSIDELINNDKEYRKYLETS